MRIFILEDDTKERTPVFRAKLIGHELVFAETAQDAIRILEDQEFDLIFLDHDLGGQQFVAANDKNTGSEVVRFMMRMNREHGRMWPTTVIHSLNTPEAIAMQSNLATTGMEVHRIPWNKLKNRLGQPGFIT